MSTVQTTDLIDPDLQELTGLQLGEPSSRFLDVVDGRDTHLVAILLPMSGSIGLYGPSCMAATQLALSEVNAAGGIAGRRLEAVFLDSDLGSLDGVERDLGNFIRYGLISGVITAGSAEVRVRTNKIVSGRVPHIYTLSCDGIEVEPNFYTIGTSPREQLVPTIGRLSERLKVRRWAFLGMDSIWPRRSNAIAKECLARCGGQVVYERYLSAGANDMAPIIESLVRSKPDIVFTSLVGQEGIEFNRMFGDLGLNRRIFRFSEVEEENKLMASGANSSSGLFVAASYFTTLDGDAHLSFSERYRAMHGALAPTMNVHGQSLYEGISFYASLTNHRQRNLSGPVMYRSARGGVFYNNWHKQGPVYLAEADGLQFQVLERLVC